MIKVIYSLADATVVAIKYNADIANAMPYIMLFREQILSDNYTEHTEAQCVVNMRLFYRKIPIYVDYNAHGLPILECTSTGNEWLLDEIVECIR